MENKKQYWSCRTCGATTPVPAHMLITYFHKDCKGAQAKSEKNNLKKIK